MPENPNQEHPAAHPDNEAWTELAAFLLAKRREAVEAARPEIERQARMKALKWVLSEGIHALSQVTRIGAEIARLEEGAAGKKPPEVSSPQAANDPEAPHA